MCIYYIFMISNRYFWKFWWGHVRSLPVCSFASTCCRVLLARWVLVEPLKSCVSTLDMVQPQIFCIVCCRNRTNGDNIMFWMLNQALWCKKSNFFWYIWFIDSKWDISLGRPKMKWGNLRLGHSECIRRNRILDLIWSQFTCSWSYAPPSSVLYRNFHIQIMCFLF